MDDIIKHIISEKEGERKKKNAFLVFNWFVIKQKGNKICSVV